MTMMEHLKDKLPLNKPGHMRLTSILLAVLVLAVLLVNALAPTQAVTAANESQLGYPYWEDNLELQDVYDLTEEGYKVSGVYDFSATDGTQLLINFALESGTDLHWGNIVTVRVDSLTYSLPTRTFIWEGEFLDDDCYQQCWSSCGYGQICVQECYNICSLEVWEAPDPNFDGLQLSEQGRLLVRESLAPSCQVPKAGDWQANASCWFHESASLPGGAVVSEDSTVVVGAGVHLNIDFTKYNLRIKPGGTVLIKPGGKIE